MKVLLSIHHPLDPNLGAPGATLALGEALRAAGCQVEFYGFEQAYGAAPPDGVSGFVRFPWRLAAFLARHANDFDVLDLSTGDGWVWAARGRPGAKPRHVLATRSHGLEHGEDRQVRAAAKRGEGRLSWKYPLYHGGFRLWEVAQSLRRADRCFLLNDDDRDFARDTLHVPAGNLTVLPNGIREYFHETPSRPTLGQGTVRLAFVGSWIERKGVVTLVRALERLDEAALDFSIDLLGTGVPEAVAAALPERIRHRVRVTPQFQHRELPALLQPCEILLFPSRAEGFGLALVEAMASGLAPVSTPVGIAPSVIEAGMNGILVPIDDPAALAAAVQHLASDRASLLEMRGHAVASVDRFRWDKIAQETIAVYEQTLTRKAS